MLIRGLTVYERSRLKEKLLFQNRIVLYQKYELLEEARFDQPQGLTFDAENEIFYIAEYENKRIRTISLKAE